MSCEEAVAEQPCKFGNCVEFVDGDGQVWAGFGPADCPCGDEWEEEV